MSSFNESLFKDNDLPFILDLSRWIAAQLVVVGHCLTLFNAFPGLTYPHMPYFQFLGVLLFFYLSGLLISFAVRAKSSKPDYGFRVFFVDRFARIYSGLVPALFFILISDWLYLKLINASYSGDIIESTSFSIFISNLLMLANNPVADFIYNTTGLNWFHTDAFGSGRSLWTLPIEWWLYMAYGWACFKYRHYLKNGNFYLFILVLALFSIVPVEHLIHGKGNGVLTYAWLLGVVMMFLLAYSPNDSITPKVGIALSIIFLGITTYYLKYYASNQVYNIRVIFFLAWSFFFFIAVFRSTNVVPQKIRRIVRFLADYSYSLYLIHITVMIWFTAWENKGIDKWLTVFAILAANVISIIFALPTEMQHPRLNRWFRHRLGIPKKRQSIRPS